MKATTYLLSGYFNHQGARGEALADVIESFASVASRVLREYLLDDQTVRLPGRLVLKVLAWLDLLLIVQPQHVILFSTTWDTTINYRRTFLPQTFVLLLQLKELRITAVYKAIIVFTCETDHHDERFKYRYPSTHQGCMSGLLDLRPSQRRI